MPHSRLSASDSVNIWAAAKKRVRQWHLLVSTLLMFIVLFTPLKSIFGLVTLSPALYLIALGLIFVPLIVMELAKAFGVIKKHK